MFKPQDITFLIESFGSTLTYTSKGEASYNPETGEVTSTDVEYTVKGHFHNNTLSDTVEPSVALGLRRLVLPAVDTDKNSIPKPKVGDTFSGLGDKVEVVSCEEVTSKGSTVCYRCQVRE